LPPLPSARVAAWIVTGLVVVALAAPAHAVARRGVIVRSVADAPVAEAPALDALALAVRERGDEAVVDPLAIARARLGAGAVPRVRLADFARARELVREGWRAYLKVDPSFAEAQLVNARRTLEGVLDLDGALELLADVSLRLGVVRLNTGRAAEAQVAFALAATLDPGRELYAQELSPAVIAAYRQASALRVAPVTLELVIDAGAQVELDGAPVEVGARNLRVTPGEHVLVVRAAGRRPAGQIVAVGAGGVRIALPLDVDPYARMLTATRPFALGVRERDALPLVDVLGSFAELDDLLIVVVTWRGGQPALLGQRCALAPVACTPVREVRFASIARLDAAAAQLVGDLAPPGEGRALGPIVLEDTRATEPEPRRPGGPAGSPAPARVWWKSPWLWAGVGALALVTGGSVWLLADDDAPSFTITLPPLGD